MRARVYCVIYNNKHRSATIQAGSLMATSLQVQEMDIPQLVVVNANDQNLLGRESPHEVCIANFPVINTAGQP